MEYIIENASQKEIKLLEENNINWYPDSMETRDIFFDDKEEYNKAIVLLKR